MDLTVEGQIKQMRTIEARAIVDAKSKDLKKISKSLAEKGNIRKCTLEEAEKSVETLLKEGFLEETENKYVLTEKANKTLEFMKRPLL
jgi:uncharacterized protein YpbB